MKQAIKQKVLLIGALELDRQMKRKLESSNYSIMQNFDYFQSLLGKSHKHYTDVEQMKRFLQHIPYLKEITEGMSMRLVEKIIHQLSLKHLPAGSQSGVEFQILLSGEIQVGQRSFVQTDTLSEVGTVLRDAWILVLSNEGYNELIRDYHENLLAQKLQTIQQYSVFSKISIQRLKNQLDQFKHEFVINNTVLYEEKQPVESFYLVLSGEVKLIQDNIELQLLGPKSVFGEMEMVEESETRMHKAIVTQQTSYYRIGYHQLRILLNSSCMYESFQQNYQLKAEFWKERKHKCKREIIVPIDFSEFKNSIPKTYHNYISATKLLKNSHGKGNIDNELKEAKEDKLHEAYKQFNYQIRQDFKHNHLLRKVLIQAKQTNHDLPIMKGLQLERYLPKNYFTHKKSLQVLSQFNETSYQRFLSDADTVSTATFVKGTRLLSAASRSGGQKFYTSSAKLSRPFTAMKKMSDV